MTFLPIDTGANAVPQTIVDAIALNDRFEGIRDTLGIGGYYGMGWLPVGTAFEYHSANSIKTTSDVDLTSLLQEGDKITWEHGTTGGDRFGWISFIDYDDTVANRTYIEIIGDTVLDEAVVADSVGISRIANPFGFPTDPNFGRIEQVNSSDYSQDVVSDTTWYHIAFGSQTIVVPKGRWDLQYLVTVAPRLSSVTTHNNFVQEVALGTSAIANRLALSSRVSGSTSGFHYETLEANIPIHITAQTTYFLQSRMRISVSSGSPQIRILGGSALPTRLIATPAYK
jgi:hypothetical protein